MTKKNDRLLTDGEIKEEFKKYFIEEDMELPEPTFTLVTQIIALVRKIQDAKTARMVAEEIFREIDKYKTRGGGITASFDKFVVIITDRQLQDLQSKCLKETK